MASSSTTLFLICNILFFSLTQGQDPTPSPTMNSTTSPPPAMNLTASTPPPPPGIDCSGCRVNPIGLTSCGFVASGGLVPPLVRLCCKALQSLTREEGISCLCNVINRRIFDTGSLDIRGAVDKVLNACTNF